MKNTVTLSVDRYNQLLTDKYIAWEELQDERSKTARFNDMKFALLKTSLDEYKIQTYDIEELLNPKEYVFPFDNLKDLLLCGIEFQEILEFIKVAYEKHRKE